jgi:hypothetical protein
MRVEYERAKELSVAVGERGHGGNYGWRDE